MAEYDNLLARYEKLDAKATPGPWEVDTNRPFSKALIGIFDPANRKYVVQFEDRELPKKPDAEFIAQTRTLLPKMAAALRALQTENTKLREKQAKVRREIDAYLASDDDGTMDEIDVLQRIDGITRPTSSYPLGEGQTPEAETEALDRYWAGAGCEEDDRG